MLSNLSIGENDVDEGENQNRVANRDDVSDESPTSVMENEDLSRSSLPKSISVRSKGYSKVSQGGGGADAAQCGKSRGTIPKPKSCGQLNTTQKVYVRGGKKEDEEEEIEVEVYNQGMTKTELCNKWQEIRGFCSKIFGNECLLCCVDFFFHLVETLVRFFNKYAYVQIAVYGKGFNKSARDAWELFQSTGVEALVAYDCSGVVLLMGTIFGGLITGSCIGIWAWIKYSDRVIMVASTAMLMGMVLVGLGMVVVESAVTSIYICFAEDPSLIERWDVGFYNEMSEILHRRLQHRSARAREVLTTA